MTDIDELAQSLGRALGQTPEYRTLARARESADDDRRIAELTNELQRAEATLQSAIREGREPEQADVEGYEALLGRLQALSVYQSLVAAQTNFDKTMLRVNAAIEKGMLEGARSSIILTS